MKSLSSAAHIDAFTACDAVTSAATGAAPAPADTVALVDAMARVDPTWVEAVAIVQAVCAQLEPGQTPPPIADILVSTTGAVSFGPTGLGDGETAVRAAGRLLTAILRQADCPMPVWEATEAARRAPGTFGSARAFGASLTCFPAHQGPQELAAYVESSRRQILNPARPATASFGTEITARVVAVLLVVTLGGIGTGVSVGALLATRASGQSAANAGAAGGGLARLAGR